MGATEIGVAFVVLASIGLVAMLVGILIWLLAVIIKAIGGGRRTADEARPTTRR